ncbi:STAS/SEC14 domain-containing protein [Gymnodinialimonas sp. 2305UL16-5]|uniref:STAS/SEC14 domain-containing protein n=1 Tax=Gymnodinialimonas mytili TaxID=3126503 RepID=UPI0030AA5482
MSEAHFHVEKTGANSLRATISGAMDAITMEAALTTLSSEMAGMAHGDMLMIDQGASWPTIGAIGVELRHWPQMMAMLHQLDRTAFVTHNPMFRAAATMESAFLPGFEIRCFNDEASAQAWLTEARDAA